MTIPYAGCKYCAAMDWAYVVGGRGATVVGVVKQNKRQGRLEAGLPSLPCQIIVVSLVLFVINRVFFQILKPVEAINKGQRTGGHNIRIGSAA